MWWLKAGEGAVGIPSRFLSKRPRRYPASELERQIGWRHAGRGLGRRLREALALDARAQSPFEYQRTRLPPGNSPRGYAVRPPLRLSGPISPEWAAEAQRRFQAAWMIGPEPMPPSPFAGRPSPFAELRARGFNSYPEYQAWREEEAMHARVGGGALARGEVLRGGGILPRLPAPVLTKLALAGRLFGRVAPPATAAWEAYSLWRMLPEVAPLYRLPPHTPNPRNPWESHRLGFTSRIPGASPEWWAKKGWDG